MNRIEWIPIQDSLGRVSFRKLSVGGVGGQCHIIHKAD